MQKQLNKSEIKEINEKLSIYGIEFAKKDNIVRKDNILLVNNKPEFFYYEQDKTEYIIPTLKSNQDRFEKMPKAIIDMGAVKFVASGADVMRPGITEFIGEFNSKDIICVADINNKRVISIGVALFSSEEMKSLKTGKVIKTIHYPLDNIWNSC